LTTPGGDASAVLTQPHSDAVALQASLATLTWRSCPLVGVQHPVSPAGALVAVKTARALLTSWIAEERSALYAHFLSLALAVPQRSLPADGLQALRAVVKAAWKLPCANALKETYWRLTMNAIPGARIRPWSCPCSCTALQSAAAPRRHTFWECSVAQAVRAQLTLALGTACSMSSVWLMRCPRPDLDRSVWALVCLAALDAMEHGRQVLWARRHAAAAPMPVSAFACVHAPVSPALQPLGDNDFVTHVPTVVLPVAGAVEDTTRAAAMQRSDGAAPRTAVLPDVAAIGQTAALRFWLSLQTFSMEHAAAPAGWAVRVGSPFLCMQSGRMVVNLPAGAVPLAHVP
jgi:hypothetical protein